jgi:hypothetical protein
VEHAGAVIKRCGKYRFANRKAHRRSILCFS